MQKAGKPKRSRALQACVVCRTRKNRCDEEQPCTYCVEHDLQCIYTRSHRAKRRQNAMLHGHRVPPPEESDQDIVHVTQTSSQRTEVHEGFLGDSGSQLYMNDNCPSDLEIRPKAVSDHVPDGTQAPSPFGLFSVDGGGEYQRRVVTPISLSPGQPGPGIVIPVGPTTRDSTATCPDVVDRNVHTRNLEFYGAASSVAFLRHVEDISGEDTGEHMATQSEPSLVSRLHNTDFLPQPTSSNNEGADASSERFYFRVARRFIDAYFANIHYIQPIFEEEEFLTRCEDLWFDRPEKHSSSFIALYYAVLSLGSLVMVWNDGEIYGANRFSWSRRLFNEAAGIVTKLGPGSNVEMVQCFYMMGKVCQHELNPHVAYLYSGQATRTALAIGLNRLANGQAVDPRSSMSAKTWWAVYCLDIQTSLALGRPDSLGPDEYHTQEIPGTEITSGSNVSTSGSQLLQIVPCMVQLSKIMRRVGLRLYTLPCTIREKVARANELDDELASWLQKLPCHLRTTNASSKLSSLKSGRPSSHIHKQHVVLMIRYYNLRMVIFGPFLTNTEEIEEEMKPIVQGFQQQCIDCAERAIDLIYETFRTDNFFQTWWYNSTYTLFAVSVLLTAVFHRFVDNARTMDGLLQQINRAIDVLEAMDECTVTRNATLIVKRTLARAEKVSQRIGRHQPSTTTGSNHASVSINIDEAGHGPNLVTEGEAADIEFDWMNAQFPVDDGQQALFWTEWAHHLEDLGA